MPSARRSRSHPTADPSNLVPGPPERLRVLSAQLHCASLSLLVDELETSVRRVERTDWTLETPRRGRPPRWLVALRAAQDAA